MRFKRSLRATFLAFCEATPELARTYARAWADQSEGRIDDEDAREIRDGYRARATHLTYLELP